MRKYCAALIVAGCWLASAARAQDTNALKTEIGMFEAQPGVVIVKGFGIFVYGNPLTQGDGIFR